MINRAPRSRAERERAYRSNTVATAGTSAHTTSRYCFCSDVPRGARRPRRRGNIQTSESLPGARDPRTPENVLLQPRAGRAALFFPIGEREMGAGGGTLIFYMPLVGVRVW